MQPLLNLIRNTTLRSLKRSGLFEVVKNSRWRQQQLLILCYHGIALEDEHQWRPFLFISQQRLEQRLEILRKGQYSILPLGNAVERLYKRDLPPRSVVLTFDDGMYDFHRNAYPQLRQHGFPATVYLSTYYSGRPYPIFSLICSYMLWKRRAWRDLFLGDIGIDDRFDLEKEEVRQHIVAELIALSDQRNLTGVEKNGVAAKLATILKIDFDELCDKRILQLMTQAEVNELARDGIDFQLHTHRHRTPLDEQLFRREIRENRERILKDTGMTAVHFCYPSGAYRPEFLTWLSAEGIVSATTCDTALAMPRSDALLLPRVVDTTGRSELMFESWASGIGQFLSSKKRARLAYDPARDNPKG
jgi:peptidoglycan/xylan/chitin deacetylase (PgdA/CDA1 family)